MILWESHIELGEAAILFYLIFQFAKLKITKNKMVVRWGSHGKLTLCMLEFQNLTLTEPAVYT